MFALMNGKPERLKEAIAVRLIALRGSRRRVRQQQPNEVQREGLVLQSCVDIPDHERAITRTTLRPRDSWKPTRIKTPR